jgi:hypothetical protein
MRDSRPFLRKRRLFRFVLLFATASLGLLGIRFAMNGTALAGVTLSSYRQLQIGMQALDVENQLGGPSSHEHVDKTGIWRFWQGKAQ